MKYKCRVQKSNGEIESIIVNAPSIQDAKALFTKDDVILIKISVDTMSLLTYQKVKTKDIIFFFSNTAMLVSAVLVC